MPSLVTIKENAASILAGRDEAGFCLALVDEIGRRLGENRGLWTYQTMSRWLQVSPTDPRLMDCIALLATSSSMKALDLRFMFFDPEHPEDIGTPLSPDEARQVFESGVLYHPETGAEVPNYKDALIPYFVPAPDLTVTS